MARAWYNKGFYDVRIDLVSKNLSPTNKKKMLSMPRKKQEYVIRGLIRKGTII